MAQNYNYSICPRCRKSYLIAVSERSGGFSGGKAVIGAVIAGPIGLAAGALGKKKTTYRCANCGYSIED